MTSPANNADQPSIGTTRLSVHMEINALSSGVQWSQSASSPLVLTYSFPWSAGTPAFAGDYSDIQENKQGLGLNSLQQAAVRKALGAWAAVANVQFVEVKDSSDSVGVLRFAATETDFFQGSASAWGYLPSDSWASGGDVWLSSVDTTEAASASYWQPGGEGYLLLVHEIGHALGLKHGFSGSNVLPDSLDSRQHTIMSYTLHANGLYGSYANTAKGYEYKYYDIAPETPMPLDIATVQHLYGANNNYHKGDDVYTFDPVGPTLSTIWDGGGTDTLNLANFTRPVLLDLEPGAYSSLPGGAEASQWRLDVALTYGKDNLAIAYGSTIENAVGGSANDDLRGNSVNNLLQGGAGDDRIDGRAGVDTAAYSGTRASYELQIRDASHASINHLQPGGDGRDTLLNVERLQFSDTRVALDVSGNAGFVAKLIGAVYGAEHVKNPYLVGVGFGYVDGGTSFDQLTQLALSDRLASSYNAKSVISLLYQNLVGQAIPNADMQHWQGVINSGQYSPLSLARLVFDMPENALNIDLVGLQHNGLAYM